MPSDLHGQNVQPIEVFSMKSEDEMIPVEVMKACRDYQNYLSAILIPAMASLRRAIDEDSVSLHQVFGANLFLAHAVDYLHAIRMKDSINEGRGALVRSFDQIFAVEGAGFSNRKFELIDAINNALKHIRLEPKRYKDLEQQYGVISFQSLLEENGRVLCILEKYRFDYVTVILLPAYRALSFSDFESIHEVLLC